MGNVQGVYVNESLYDEVPFNATYNYNINPGGSTNIALYTYSCGINGSIYVVGRAGVVWSSGIQRVTVDCQPTQVGATVGGTWNQGDMTAEADSGFSTFTQIPFFYTVGVSNVDTLYLTLRVTCGSGTPAISAQWASGFIYVVRF
jgi:hypothetical protein